MNKVNKPALAKALWKMTEKPMPTLPTSNLLGGGDLFSKLQ